VGIITDAQRETIGHATIAQNMSTKVVVASFDMRNAPSRLWARSAEMDTAVLIEFQAVTPRKYSPSSISGNIGIATYKNTTSINPNKARRFRFTTTDAIVRLSCGQTQD
jgi:hypothetical protein